MFCIFATVKPTLHKYSGAGNDFIVVDGRTGEAGPCREPDFIKSVCDRKTGFTAADGVVGADGLMILGSREGFDFAMEFFNPDGSSGMMCGNGGRCIAAFASHLGIVPADGRHYVFSAPDGPHSAEILSSEGPVMNVRLSMKDVSGIRDTDAGGYSGLFMDTGARHFVVEVPGSDGLDVEGEGRRLRHDAAFVPEGTNVDFIEHTGAFSLKLRTFEKGVEAETLACGTGAVAAALAAWSRERKDGRFSWSVRVPLAVLTVEFSVRGGCPGGIFLAGPAEMIQ